MRRAGSNIASMSSGGLSFRAYLTTVCLCIARTHYFMLTSEDIQEYLAVRHRTIGIYTHAL